MTFKPQLEESLVRGVPSTIERAVSNLLDNAAKWSPPGGEVDVIVRNGELAVRDRGPGIAEKTCALRLSVPATWMKPVSERL